MTNALAKGTRWRKAVQDWFTLLGYECVAKAWMQPGDDITVSRGMLMLSVECKDHRALAIGTWVDQAERQCPEGQIPIVVAHRLGHSRAEDAFVILSAKSFGDLLESL
jgi:hypothetical protein